MRNLPIIIPNRQRTSYPKAQAHTRKIAKLKVIQLPTISLSIPISLLEKIEQNIEGKNRSDKIRKCLLKGIEIANLRTIKEGKAIPPSLMRNPK